MKLRIYLMCIFCGFLASCGPNYGSQGSRQFRGDGFGNTGVGVSSYGYQGGPT